MSEGDRERGLSVGASLAIGVAVTFALGMFGAAGWLAWVWSTSPAEVRERVTTARKAIVVTMMSLCVAAYALGFAMTIRGLQSAFAYAPNRTPSERTTALANGIADAMNWTAIGILCLVVGMIFTLVAGYGLLRARDRMQ